MTQGQAGKVALIGLIAFALIGCGEGSVGEGNQGGRGGDNGGGGGGGGGVGGTVEDAGAQDAGGSADGGSTSDKGGGPPSGPSSMGSGGGVGMKTWKVGSATYHSYVPDSYTDGEAWPLLLHLHGQGLTAAKEVPRFKSNADAMKFIVVGLEAKDTANGWSETEFPSMTATIKDARTHWNIANARIYVSGYSAGSGIGITYATLFDPEDVAKATFLVAGFAGFCGPWQSAWDGDGKRKVAIYGASNMGDPNFSSVQKMVTYYMGRGHPGTFKNETGSTSGHTYTSKSITDAMTWLFANPPG